MSRLKITLRVDFDAVHSIGPGKVALLEKMRDSGSLSLLPVPVRSIRTI